MAGYPNTMKRTLVRQALARRENREMSFGGLAVRLGVSRQLVTSVWREMVAAGELKAPTLDDDTPGEDRRRFHGEAELLKPGGAVRGGYVYGPDGKPMREIDYLRQHGKRK